MNKLELSKKIEKTQNEVDFFTKILDNLKTPIYSTAIKEPPQILWANKVVENMMGMDFRHIAAQYEEIYQGKIDNEYMEEIYHDAVKDVLDGNHHKPIKAVYPMAFPLGHQAWFMATANALFRDRNNVPRVSICFGIDVSDQIKTDQDLQTAMRINHSLRYKLLLQELSNTEQELVALISKGKTSKEIAKETHRGIKTIESHRRNIFKKLDCKNVAELTKLFFFAQESDNLINS